MKGFLSRIASSISGVWHESTAIQNDNQLCLQLQRKKARNPDVLKEHVRKKKGKMECLKEQMVYVYYMNQ